jgi:hypothetical protein
MAERWLPIVGYEGSYEVSDLGRVRSLTRLITTKAGVTKRRRGQIMTPFWSPRRRRYSIRLRKADVQKTFDIHVLVAVAFHGTRPEGMWACHMNDDARDNRAENLRWDTPSSNHHDMVNFGNHHYGKRTHCKNGHEFTPENTAYRVPSGDAYVRPNERRDCLACRRINNARRSAG